jgi:hypothetical protein
MSITSKAQASGGIDQNQSATSGNLGRPLIAVWGGIPSTTLTE